MRQKYKLFFTSPNRICGNSIKREAFRFPFNDQCAMQLVVVSVVVSAVSTVTTM